MRRSRGAPLLGVAVLAALVTACGGGSGKAAGFVAFDGHAQFCGLVTQLDATGKVVAKANVNDPDRFDAILRAKGCPV